MIWSTWRQFRGTIITAVAVPLLLALVTVVVTIVAGEARPYSTFFHCFGYSTRQCLAESTLTVTSALTLVLPVVLGLFVGVTVFSRDIERGTHVLGLTQAVSRRRWYATRILVVFVPAVLALLVLGFASYWAQYHSFSGVFGFAGTVESRLEFPTFGATGLVPAGYTALALMIGSTAALLLRNTIGAMIGTLIAIVAVLVVFPTVIREHYETQKVEEVALENTYFGGYSTSYSLSTEGFYPRWIVAEDYIDVDGRPVDVPSELCTSREDYWSEARDDETTVEYEARLDAMFEEAARVRVECLRENGVDHFEKRYHADNSFWRFQLTETALSLLVAALFTGLSLRLVQRLRP